MSIGSPRQWILAASAPAAFCGCIAVAFAQGIDDHSASASATNVAVTVNVLANRHPISPYIYGANFPPSEQYVEQGGVTLSRWGGNNSSRYNWKLNAKNDDFDWYFENFSWGTPNSANFIAQAVAAGGSPLMTIPMLTWVAKDTKSSSFSVKKYGAQCAADPYNPDAGDGILPGANCLYAPDYLTGNDPTDANTRLLDAPSPGDPTGSVYRNQWIESIAPKFGTRPHFYQLDNEPEIWSSTHRDVHPTPTGYDELAADIVHAGHTIRSFDRDAVRFAPVFDSWWFYWNGENGNDKGDHGGLDFLPWLLNEIWYNDQVIGSRSFDVFDVHAYFNGPDTAGMTTAQVRAAALRETRDWWDPDYVSESGAVNQNWATFIEPDKTVAFVLPRMKALANSIYPGTPVSVTEWNGALAGESDFSTALVDADAYGILGREGIWGASRWVAADASTPAFQALKLYRNANGSHQGFAPISVSAANNASPNSFSVYAAVDSTGETLTLMIVNKSPTSQARVSFAIDAFDPATMTKFTLSQARPAAIVASNPTAWSDTQTFAPYSATLIVVKGKTTRTVAEEWELNPDTLLAPAPGEVTIHPTITGGNGPVTLTSAAGSGGVTLEITGKVMNQLANGSIVIKTPSAPGLYPFTVTAKDSAGTVETQQGWVLATVPAAKLTKTGDRQSANPGAKLTLTATYMPGASGASGATAGGVDLLFTASAGTLNRRIVRTQANGEATVELTLPAKRGPVTVTAAGPVFWGAPPATFTETVK